MSINTESFDLATEFIASHPLAVLSINQKHHAPYSAAVFITSDESLNLSFVTKTETTKYSAICIDNRVTVTSYDLDEQQMLQANGKATEISNDAGLAKDLFDQVAKAKLTKDPNWIPPIVKLQAGEYAVFKIGIEWMRIVSFSSSLSNEASFTQIIG